MKDGSTPARALGGFGHVARLFPAAALAAAAACLCGPVKAQEDISEADGDAPPDTARPQIEDRAARPRPPAEPVASPVAPATFSAAFAPLAEAPRPDLAVPTGAVDLAEIEPTVEAPAFRSLGIGTASYYGRRFHGRRTANGERFDMNALTAAHRTLPFGSLVRVTNPSNGRSVTVRINDRGPFVRGRVIDVSRAAAKRLGLIRRGHAPVRLELLE